MPNNKMTFRVSSYGFSLLELMVAIAVIAVLSAFAFPSFQVTLQNNRLINKTNDIVAAINIARQTAISRGLVTFVCHSNNADTATPTCDGGTNSNWNTGVIIYSAPERTIVAAQRDYAASTDALVQQFDFADDDQITFTQANDNDYIAFSGNGLLFTAGATEDALSFTICDDRTAESGRTVNVSLAGRISTVEATCT